MVDYVRILGFGAWEDLAPAVSEVARGGGDPLALKQALAERLVARFHGAEAAAAAAAHFRRVVQRREVPEAVPEVEVRLDAAPDAGLLDVVRAAFGLASNNEARRLVVQRAVHLDGRAVTDPALRLTPGTYLMRAGRRRFARVRLV
jgi:tyrosyl-tRNA synthetase